MATEDTPVIDTPAVEAAADTPAPEGEFDAAIAAMYGDDPPAADTPAPGAPGELPGEVDKSDPAPEGDAPSEPEAAKPAKPVEAKPAEATPPTEPDEKQARWDKLVEAERAKRTAQRESKNLVDRDELRARAEKDPIGVAEELGITYSALIAHLTEGTPAGTTDGQAPAPTPGDSELLKRVERMEAATKARDEQYQQESRERARHRELGTISQMVGDRPACKAFSDESVPLALEVAASMCTQAGIAPSADVMPTVYAEALDRVETHIRQREIARIERLRQIPDVAAKLGTAGNGTLPAAGIATPGAPAASPTIGGAAAATAAPREKTEEELFEESLEAMYS